MIARTLRARVRGIGRVEEGCGVLLGGGAVHTWRPRRAVGVAALDADGVVVAARRLAPRRTWRCRGAAWMLELPSGRRLPALGTRIRLYAIRQLGSRGR